LSTCSGLANLLASISKSSPTQLKMTTQNQLTTNWFPAEQLTRKLPQIDRRKALVVLDLQNDFLSEDAKLSVKQPPDFKSQIQALLPAFRDSGCIVWVKTEFEAERLVNDVNRKGESVILDDQVVEINTTTSGTNSSSSAPSSRSTSRLQSHTSSDLVNASEIKRATAAGKGRPQNPASVPGNETFLSVGLDGKRAELCVPGSEGANISDHFKPLLDPENDMVLTTTYYSAFKSTNLVTSLRSKLVTELYICGLMSNTSVYATALDAAQYGFAITLFEDCLGYRDKNRHDAAVKKMVEYMGVKTTTSTKYSQALEAASRKSDCQKRHKGKTQESNGSKPEIEKPMDNLEIADKPAEKPVRVQKAVKMPKSRKKKKHADLSTQAKDKPEEAGHVAGSETSGSLAKENLPAVKPSTQNPSEAVNPPVNPDATSTALEDEQIRLTLANVPREPLKPNQKPRVPPADSNTSLNALPSPTFQVLEAVSASLQDVALSARSPSPSPGADTILTPTHVQTATIQTIRPIHSRTVSRTHIRGSSCPPLGPGDIIGEGDSRILYDLLSSELSTEVFEKVKSEVQWQTMHHRGGEVPRLVAVEGEIKDDGSFPLYRHPADESPPLLPFSETISKIRDEVQRILKHPVNHVLIQCYRHGQDYISEHSDKTLDIVRGSSIVNVSLGAQRTMTLRTKKSAAAHISGAISETPVATTNGANEMAERTDQQAKILEQLGSEETPKPRNIQRVTLPHNSMFILGQVSNMKWLHGIRPDKRPKFQKSDEELSYNGERISLTFRHIGTYLDKTCQHIWGQGARSKEKTSAGRVVNGDTYEAEQMIKAFGTENQQSEFDWLVEYGSGFDVLNIINANPKLFTSGDQITDSRVKICLAEKGLIWDMKQASPSHDWKTSTAPLEQAPQIQFIDHDAARSEIEGDLAILLYLETYCVSDALLPPMDRRGDIAAVYTRTFASDTLLASWRGSYRTLQDFQPSEAAKFLVPDQVKIERETVVTPFRRELTQWEHYASKTQYIATNTFTMADCAFWPVLNEIVHAWIDWTANGYPKLAAYWSMVEKRESIKSMLSEYAAKQPVVGKEVKV
jgi:nicotinamidase-related amidase/glutathione S-transferase/alkylated DNA repair dioxygenase AlkB